MLVGKIPDFEDDQVFWSFLVSVERGRLSFDVDDRHHVWKRGEQIASTFLVFEDVLCWVDSGDKNSRYHDNF